MLRRLLDLQQQLGQAQLAPGLEADALAGAVDGDAHQVAQVVALRDHLQRGHHAPRLGRQQVDGRGQVDIRFVQEPGRGPRSSRNVMQVPPSRLAGQKNRDISRA